MNRTHGLILALCTSVALLACGGHDDAAPDTTTAGLAANAATNACSGVPTPPITSAGIGPVRVGGSVSDVTSRCATHDTTFALEGTQERGTVVRFGPYAVTALTTGSADSTISRVIVADSAFRTDRGIGVGSYVRALRDAYGQVCASLGEGNVVVVAAALPGVSFATSTVASALPDGGRNLDRNPAAVPDSAHITSLWVYEGGESTCGGS
jgi:hypothetical protein